VLCGLAALATVFVVSRVNAFRQTGEEGARVWFYDQSEQRLYAVPASTIPPHKGIGGLSGVGVRAVVVTFRGDPRDAEARRIAYLETYAPDLKALMEQIRQARLGGRAYAGPSPPRESDYCQTNTLVRRVNEPAWHTSNSEEAQTIRSEWRAWCGPQGQPPMVSAP